MAHQIKSLQGEMVDRLYRTMTSFYQPGYIDVDGYVIPQNYVDKSNEIESFEVRDDDVWLCTFPKSGTTWTQEMVWCIANGCDYEKAKEPIMKRFPFLELSCVFDFKAVARRHPDKLLPESVMDSINNVEKMSSPRFIKTHLPFHLLPRQITSGEKKPKIIYLVRNPKDVCISYYHHCRVMKGFNGTFEEFSTLFLTDTIHYGPYWKHVQGYWDQRNNKNFLRVTFEDMKKDLRSVITEISKFLDKNVTDDQMSGLLEHLSFASIKANPAANHEEILKTLKKLFLINQEGSFIRNGNTNQWKSVMTPELIQRFDNWIGENSKNAGLSY